MSDSKPGPRRASVPQLALQAAMSDAAADPVRRALWLEALEQQLRPCLPPPLSGHCRLGNVAGGRLVFIVDSPVWKARLRLAAPEIIEVARSIGLAATEVVAKVSTAPVQTAQGAPKALKPMSTASRLALQAALTSLQEPAPTAGGEDPDTRGGYRHRRSR